MPDKPFRLDGKVALVTGAGRGLGRGIAIALADAGAELLLDGRSFREFDAVSAEIAAASRATPLAFDVTDAAATRAGSAGSPRNLGGSIFSSTMPGSTDRNLFSRSTRRRSTG